MVVSWGTSRSGDGSKRRRARRRPPAGRRLDQEQSSGMAVQDGARWQASDYTFLTGYGVSPEAVTNACAVAHTEGTRPEDVLIRFGHISVATYHEALLQELQRQPPAAVGNPAAPASTETNPHLRFAINGLRRATPRFSAARGLWTWQLIVLMALPGLCLGAVVVAPALAVMLMLGLLTVVFFAVVMIRLLASVIVVARHLDDAELSRVRLADSELPNYAVLVPLYGEADIAADTVAALAKLNYPPDRLDIVLILEQDDHETHDAVGRCTLPAHMRVVVVPASLPRTKPKALNYALAGLTSDYVVIYDAEDVPETDQLRKAAARFAADGGGRIGCLQARLNIYNWRESWIARGIMAQTPPPFGRGVSGDVGSWANCTHRLCSCAARGSGIGCPGGFQFRTKA